MRNYLVLDVRRALRDRRYMGLVVGWPIASYLLFSTVFGGAGPANRSEGLDPRTEIMVAMAAFGAIGAVLMATGPRLATERQIGWLRQLRLTPLPARSVLATRLLAAMILSLPAVVLTFAVAAAVNGVRLDATQWLLMTVLLCAGCLPFAALGLVIGCVADAETATGLTMIVYPALGALGGLWMPVKILPHAMQTVAGALPSHALAQLGWRVAAGVTPPASAALVLGAWLLAGALAAVAVARRVTARV